MKIKPKNQPKGITEFNTVDGIVQITHFQSIKQSLNWQSADCSYGMTIKVKDNPKVVKRAVRQMEKKIETLLTEKFNEHRDVLKSIAADNESNKR